MMEAASWGPVKFWCLLSRNFNPVNSPWPLTVASTTRSFERTVAEA